MLLTYLCFFNLSKLLGSSITVDKFMWTPWEQVHVQADSGGNQIHMCECQIAAVTLRPHGLGKLTEFYVLQSNSVKDAQALGASRHVNH